MRDVLGTIQADQDAIIRAGSRGALVVDGGPGTGKTVVALHRTAYLLYSDPRLGPPQGRGALRRPAPALPRLRLRRAAQPRRGGRADLHAARPRAGGRHRRRRGRPARWPGSRPTPAWSRPSSRPCGCTRSRRTQGMEVETPWGDVWLGPTDWAEAFDSPEPGAAAQRGARHRSGRRCSASSSTSCATRSTRRGGGPSGARGADDDFDAYGLTRRTPTSGSAVRSRERGPGATPSAGPGRCSSRPTSSATCGRCRPTCGGARPGSSARRSGRSSARTPAAWTVSDLPLLDAARRRLGDPEASRRRAPAARPPTRPNASGWPTSSPTSSRPTTPRCG